LRVESVERLRDESVVERLWEAVGKRREDVEVGKEVVDVIVSTICQHLQMFSVNAPARLQDFSE